MCVPDENSNITEKDMNSQVILYESEQYKHFHIPFLAGLHQKTPSAEGV